MNEAMQETTLATQADFQPDEVLAAQMVSGTHPVTVQGGLLHRVWHLHEEAKNGNVNTERVREIAAGIPQLRQIVEQYIDPATGKPRAECADQSNPTVVAMKEETACFGRKCGFAEGCFKQCSLGPSHNQQGQTFGVVGQAPQYNSAGQQLGDTLYEGVLKTDENGQPEQPPRHRDNSCLTLSLFLRLIGVPPAHTASLADSLWDILPTTLAAVEQGLQVQPEPTPKPAPTQEAPAAPPAPTAPPAPPTEAPAPPAPAPAPAAEPATPPAQHGLDPLFVGIDLDYDQLCEMHALQHALGKSPEKPKSHEAIKNMEKRHVEQGKTPKAVISAWRKTCQDRDLMHGKGVSARLKQEFWPEHVPVPSGYYDGIEGVSSTATVPQPAAAPAPQPAAPAAPAAQPAAPAAPAAQPAAPAAPAAQPAAPETVAVQPQAPAQPAPKTPDRDETAPSSDPGAGNSPVDINTVTLDPESKEALKEHTEAMNNLAAALRGANFQGQRDNGGNSGGAEQPQQPAAEIPAPVAAPQPAVQQPAPPAAPAPAGGQQPAGAGQPAPAPAPAAPAPPATNVGVGGTQPPPPPPAAPSGYGDYGAPAEQRGPIVDTGGAR